MPSPLPAAPPPGAPPQGTPPRGHRRARVLVAVGMLALLAVAGFLVARRAERSTPPELVGAPLRMATAEGDAVFLLTGHWQTYVLRAGRGGGWRTWTDLHVDLWRFDPATARPVWRRRVLTERNGARSGLALLGAQGGVLWLFARGPLAVSADDGAPVADARAIEARVPALRGLLPREPRYYALGADGLVVTAADARVHRVDAAVLAARPAAAAGPRVAAPASFTPSATYAFQRRGLSIPGRWLGVLADEEAERFRGAAAAAETGRGALARHEASVLAPPPANVGAPLRHRLWSARVTPVSRAPRDWPRDLPADWGTRDRYSEIRPLPESPEFLQGGLLAVGGVEAPLTVRDPDGVFVLHHDRLGEEGRLRLTRVAGPGGRAVWEAALPLSVLQSVMPGARTLVLLGREYAPPGRRPRDPYHAGHARAVSVDVATGTVRAYDLVVDGRAVPAIR